MEPLLTRGLLTRALLIPARFPLARVHFLRVKKRALRRWARSLAGLVAGGTPALPVIERSSLCDRTVALEWGAPTL